MILQQETFLGNTLLYDPFFMNCLPVTFIDKIIIQIASFFANQLKSMHHFKLQKMFLIKKPALNSISFSKKLSDVTLSRLQGFKKFNYEDLLISFFKKFRPILLPFQ